MLIFNFLVIARDRQRLSWRSKLNELFMLVTTIRIARWQSQAIIPYKADICLYVSCRQIPDYLTASSLGSVLDRWGSHFESCVCGAVSSDSSYHPQNTCYIKPHSLRWHKDDPKDDTPSIFYGPDRIGSVWHWHKYVIIWNCALFN